MYFGIKWTPLFISEFSCLGQSCLGQVMKYIAVSACVWKEVLALIFWIGFKCHSSLLSLVFLLVGCRARSVSLQKTIGPYDIYFMELHIKSPIHAMLSLRTRHMNSHAKKLYLSFIYNLLSLQSPLQTLPCFPVTVQQTQCSNSQEFFAMDLVCHWKKSKSNQRKGFCRSISSSESNLNNKRSFRSFWCNNRNVFIHPIVP